MTSSIATRENADHVSFPDHSSEKYFPIRSIKNLKPQDIQDRAKKENLEVSAATSWEYFRVTRDGDSLNIDHGEPKTNTAPLARQTDAEINVVYAGKFFTYAWRRLDQDKFECGSQERTKDTHVIAAAMVSPQGSTPFGFTVDINGKVHRARANLGPQSNPQSATCSDITIEKNTIDPDQLKGCGKLPDAPKPDTPPTATNRPQTPPIATAATVPGETPESAKDDDGLGGGAIAGIILGLLLLLALLALLVFFLMRKKKKEEPSAAHAEVLSGMRSQMSGMNSTTTSGFNRSSMSTNPSGYSAITPDQRSALSRMSTNPDGYAGMSADQRSSYSRAGLSTMSNTLDARSKYSSNRPSNM